MDKSQSFSSDNYNYGLSILKIIMCFEVVLGHCWTPEELLTNCTGIKLFIIEGLIFLRGLAVPIFMFSSFFLLGRKGVLTKDQALKRIERLVIPYFAWPFVYFGIYFVLEKVVIIHFHSLDGRLLNGISDLFWQLIAGHSEKLCAVMWFQFVLIILTVVFFFLLKIKGTKRILVLSFLAIAALVFQYSGFNFYCFSQLRYELEFPLGRIAEMIPYAVLGFVLSDSKILLYAEKKREYFLFFSIILFIIVAILQTESYAKGFGYEGVSKIISSVLLFACFYLLPEKFFSCFCKRLVKWLSKYELGIYCSHVLIRTCVYGIFMVIGLPKYTFGGSILIWSFSLALSVLISLIPSNFFRGMVK